MSWEGSHGIYEIHIPYPWWCGVQCNVMLSILAKMFVELGVQPILLTTLHYKYIPSLSCIITLHCIKLPVILSAASSCYARSQSGWRLVSCPTRRTRWRLVLATCCIRRRWATWSRVPARTWIALHGHETDYEWEQ